MSRCTGQIQLDGHVEFHVEFLGTYFNKNRDTILKEIFACLMDIDNPKYLQSFHNIRRIKFDEKGNKFRKSGRIYIRYFRAENKVLIIAVCPMHFSHDKKQGNFLRREYKRIFVSVRASTSD